MDQAFTDHQSQMSQCCSDVELLSPESGQAVCRTSKEPLPWSQPRLGRASLPLGTEDADCTVPTSPGKRDPQLHQCILEGEIDTLDPQEILEILLTKTCSAAARRLARTLLDHFGSLGGVLAAPAAKLRHICGDKGEHTVLGIKAARAALLTVIREPLKDRPIINTASSLMDYLFVSLRHDTTEIIRILFLDKNNGLIKDEMHCRGTVDQAPIYPREIVKRVIDLDASAIILVHNHPSGNPTPSLHDIAITEDIVNALHFLGVVFHDHVIVSRNNVISFRRLGLIKPCHRNQATHGATNQTLSASDVSLLHAAEDIR